MPTDHPITGDSRSGRQRQDARRAAAPFPRSRSEAGPPINPALLKREEERAE